MKTIQSLAALAAVATLLLAFSGCTEQVSNPVRYDDTDLLEKPGLHQTQPGDGLTSLDGEDPKGDPWERGGPAKMRDGSISGEQPARTNKHCEWLCGWYFWMGDDGTWYRTWECILICPDDTCPNEK